MSRCLLPKSVSGCFLFAQVRCNFFQVGLGCCTNDFGCCDCFLFYFQFFGETWFQVVVVFFGSPTLFQVVSTCFRVRYVVSICSGLVDCSGCFRLLWVVFGGVRLSYIGKISAVAPLTCFRQL